MSYGVSQALQMAVYATLQGDAPLTALVGEAVYDAVPAGSVPDIYVALGPEDVTARHDSSGSVTKHRLIVSVVGRADGFALLKSAAGAVSDSLHGATPTLSRGRIMSMDFQKARARKINGNRERRIDLWFRATVEDR